ncbi:MAG TPA: hypothetical protein VEN81_05710 [Planctomycetota bacterium]|nr:hypothetical protein [Planctomycetota bacterium]
MKTIFVLCGLCLAGAVAWVVFERPWADHHGGPFRGLPAVGMAELLARPGDYLKKEVRLEGRVRRECPCCGCWIVLGDPAGRELRVESGDTVGHLPYRLGKHAIVEGELIRYGEGYELIGAAVEFR